MPRLARTVCAGVPHHITQRGNRRGDVFFSDADRRAYLLWMQEYTRKAGAEILAYCLMTNHVHLIAVPAEADSLQRALKPLHMRHAQRINRLRGWTGHLWQGRFFSSALDEAHLWTAVRYVECNPLRAGLVQQAEDHPWSSAAAHCGLRHDPILTRAPDWRSLFDGVDNWSEWLREADDPARIDLLRRNTNRSLPSGSDKFVQRLEEVTGQMLRNRPRGRPRKTQDQIRQ